MIKTQYGNDVTPIEAITEAESGAFCACFAVRKIDGKKRFYELCQLKADGGIQEIIAALAALPARSDTEMPAHETW